MHRERKRDEQREIARKRKEGHRVVRWRWKSVAISFEENISPIKPVENRTSQI